MNFDDLQKAWQSQDAAAKVTINADVLLKEVRRIQITAGSAFDDVAPGLAP